MEYKVPISKRYLIVEGVISPRLELILAAALGMVATTDERICALAFAYDNIPLGFQFEVVFLREDPKQAIKATSVIKAVTQQFSKPFDVIPRGWKTFTLPSFPDGVPTLIKNLPIVDGWYESERAVEVFLSSEETWRAILAERDGADEEENSG